MIDQRVPLRPLDADALCVIDRNPGLTFFGLLVLLSVRIDRLRVVILILQARSLIVELGGIFELTSEGRAIAARLGRSGVCSTVALRSASQW